MAVVAVVTGSHGLATEEAPRSSPKVKDLVRQIIYVYGGRDVLKNVHSLSALGVLESPMYERPAEYSLDLREDRKLRVEIRVGNSFEIRILNGMRGYYHTGDSRWLRYRSRFLSMAYQFKELTMPQQLMASSFTITDGGRKEVNDTPVRFLLLRTAKDHA